MAGRSHADQFARVLKKRLHERASFVELADSLGPKWDADRVEAKARQFDDDVDIPIIVTRSGVQYFGTETGKKPGLYKEVRRGMERRWGPDNSMRRIAVRHTSRHPTRGSGSWSQPDLVAQVRRRSNAMPPIVYLAIEVEQPKGFGIASIYQAYEFGRGANFSWVFYAGPECDGRKWDQIEVAARDLGVGIVHAARPTVPSKWKTAVGARQRDRTTSEQGDFFERSGVRPWDFERD